MYMPIGLLKELIKLPTRADNSQSAREVQVPIGRVQVFR